MKYISTRGEAAPVDFVGACLAGLAPDGGLYVPEVFPQIEPAERDESYTSVATRILSAFAGDSIPAADIQMLCERAYAGFAHQSVAPLVQWGSGKWLLELHHGPTLAFKDIAMQVIGQFYNYLLAKSGKRMTIMCATSGDTGGAAAAAFAGSKHADMVILHPYGRISPVQRLFMTTTGAENVINLALDTDFDECQAIVKSLFADREYADSIGLSGVNSINWVRIAAQMVYYATAQAALDQPIRFVVPSGNMGDALAGYVAARCGLLTGGLDVVCAVNENDSLHRLFRDGVMNRKPAVSTPSPAMDISVPSNFERLLFEAADRDPTVVKNVYDLYAQTGESELPDGVKSRLSCFGIRTATVNNADTLEEMATVARETGWLICPHTAVGTRAARTLSKGDSATVVLATAHAAKFPETVLEATGRDAPLPERVAGLKNDGEVFERMEASVAAVRKRLEERAK